MDLVIQLTELADSAERAPLAINYQVSTIKRRCVEVPPLNQFKMLLYT
jgi:hypothetical protein